MLSLNGGPPSRTTQCQRIFCPDCSKVIFIANLLASVSHPHRLAVPFPSQLLSSSSHLLMYLFSLIRYYNRTPQKMSRFFQEFPGHFPSFCDRACARRRNCRQKKCISLERKSPFPRCHTHCAMSAWLHFRPRSPPFCYRRLSRNSCPKAPGPGCRFGSPHSSRMRSPIW